MDLMMKRNDHRTEEEILIDIHGIYHSLSPENLSEDGMIRGQKLVARKARLERMLDADFKELGRTVSEDELSRYFRSAEWLKRLLAAPEGIKRYEPFGNRILVWTQTDYRFAFTREVFESVAELPF
jgi:hypothetical protein